MKVKFVWIVFLPFFSQTLPCKTKKVRLVPYSGEQKLTSNNIRNQRLSLLKALHDLDQKDQDLPFITWRTLANTARQYDRKVFIKKLIHIFNTFAKQERVEKEYHFNLSFQKIPPKQKRVFLNKTLHYIERNQSLITVITYPIVCFLKKHDTEKLKRFRMKEHDLVMNLMRKKKQINAMLAEVK